MPDQTSATQTGTQTADGAGQGGQQAAQQNAGITFTREQQMHIDTLIADRLKRAQGKWEAEQKTASEKAAGDVEAKKLADEKRFQELADKAAKERDKALAERDSERARVKQ